MLYRGGVSVEAYDKMVTSLLRQKELLEIELAVIHSEWDAFFVRYKITLLVLKR